MASTEQVEQSLKDLNEAVSCGMDNAEPERAFESICFADVALNKLISNGVIQVPPEDELNYFNEIDRFEAVFPGSDKRMRMDGCLILPNGHGELDLHIFVTDYERRLEVEKITEEEIKKLSDEAYYFVYSAGEESFKNWLSRERSAYEVCSQIIKNKDRISSVFIWILSNRFADGEYIRRSNITLWGQPVELVRRVVDLSYLADSDAEKAHNFLDFSPVGGIDVLKLNLGDNSQFDCYLASIPATYLVQIYSAYGTRLIEKNVRAYLGNKKANKGIESTIKEAPETFVALNNGLVMVAEDVETSAGKLKKLKNFQIVNGGQTTATLYYTYKAAERMKKKDEGKRIKDNFAKIQVPLKIVRIKKSTLESDGFDFAAQIPIAANTQNAIKASDLSASVKSFISALLLRQIHLLLAEDPERELVVAEFCPNYDLTCVSEISQLFKSPTIISFEKLWNGRVLNKSEICVGTRYHFHLIASRSGCRGIFGSPDAYYGIKHDSLLPIGSNWQNVDLYHDRVPPLCFPRIQEESLVRKKRAEFGLIMSLTS